MAELENWQMWRERCAAARCTPAAQLDLCGFAFDRFRRYLQKVRPSSAPPSASDAWHAFETHLALGRTRATKAWKAWLFARGGAHPTLNCIQGGATLIMRDVVRTYLRNEQSPPWMLSLDAPAGQPADQDGGVLAVADLLPDPADPLMEVDAHDLQLLVEQLFAEVIAPLSAREQIAVTVYQRGKRLSHRAVTGAARCGKSSLCNSLHQGMRKMAGVLTAKLPGESPDTRIRIAQGLIAKLAAETEKALETAHPDLFRYIKEESDDGS